MEDDGSSDQQLISFFAYAVVIYPAANYLISRRQWPQHWRILAAVTFLVLVATAQVMYENAESGPNYYQLMNVRRGDPIERLKKVHRKLSIDLHPDKTPDPAKRALFLKVEEAYEVLRRPETRGLYERLGPEGVKRASKAAVDTGYLLTQMLVHYTSTAVFAFIMTISDTGGDSMAVSFIALASVFLVECLLVLENEALPTWLFPFTTSFELVALLRRLFPAFMHGCRTVLGALYVDEKAYRVASLSSLSQSTRHSGKSVSTTVRATLSELKTQLSVADVNGTYATSSSGAGAAAGASHVVGVGASHGAGLVEDVLGGVSRRLGTGGEPSAKALVDANDSLLRDPRALQAHCRGSPGLDLLCQGAVFLAARLLLRHLKPSTS
jgi:hypothetical protein